MSAGPRSRTAPVFSRTRIRRIRVVLWLALALGVFVVVLEAGALTESDTDRRTAGTALVIYLVTVALSGVALWRLTDRDFATRLAVTVAATYLAIVGVLTVGAIFGLLSLLLGLGLLALAMLPDDPGVADGPGAPR